MLVLVTYDICDNRSRGRLHKLLKEYGLNTQRSVFECDLDAEGLRRLAVQVGAMIDAECDSVRFYRLCATCQRKVVISGQGLKVTQLDFMLI